MSPAPSWSSATLTSVTARASDGAAIEIDLCDPDALPVRAALAAYVAASRGETTARIAFSGEPESEAAEGWLTEIGERLDQGLHRLLQHDPAIAQTDPVTLADQLVAAVPTRHDFDRLTGLFYDTAGLTTWLGITRQALDARSTRGSLMCPLADGTRVYPAWQFRSDKTTVPHLAEALRILRAGAESPWTVATWLRTPLSEFENTDAVTWLDNGGDPERVLAAAREDADRWVR